MIPIIITGPTATGKTELAIELAERLNAEIISADSMQIYRYMDIGTAKPSKEDRHRVKHYLIDIRDPNESFSAGEFVENSLRLIDEIHSKGKQVLIVGGTGFYIDALVNGLDQVGPVSEDIKRFFDDMCEELGSFYLYEWLNLVDEKWAKNISPSDCQRIKRGLSYYVDKGIPLSSRFHASEKRSLNFHVFVLFASKDFLKKRIEERAKKMLGNGLIEEVEKLLKLGFAYANPLKAIGYREVLDFLRGKISKKEELVHEIVKDTLAFTKRQITFFKSKFPEATWINIENQEPLTVILDAVSGHLS